MISEVVEELSAEIDRQTAEQLASEMDGPVHRAKCVECAHAVDFRSMASGRSFILVDPSPDAVYGVGESGRPICPNGHGEMALADDQFKPAADAFAEAAARLEEAQQASLPGVFPTFDFAAVFKEIVEQAQCVERLKADYDEAKQEAADAKKALDKSAELLMRITLEFERRRKEKAAGPNDASFAAPSAIQCVWDQQHPEDPCPLCAMGNGQAFFAGLTIAPIHAQAHADQVIEYRTTLDVQATLDALDGHVHDLPAAIVAEWSPEDRAAVRTWASNNDAPFSDMPAVLGRPHIAAAASGDDAMVQACTECGAVLRTWNAGDGSIVWLPTCARVRTDCPGARTEPEHHYPARRKPRTKAKK
jgi:hypothetical protein